MHANGRGGGERGAGRLKAIVWLTILGAFVYVGIKVVPILFNEYQFQDAMQNTARFATVNRQSPEEIRKSLVQEAQANEIPVQPENIHVTAEAGNVKISADYTIVVNLQVYQLTLNLHPSASNNAL
jgi:predicted membrane protein